MKWRSLQIIILLIASALAWFAAAEDVAETPGEVPFSMGEDEFVKAAGASAPAPETETTALTQTTYCAPLEAETGQRCHVFINGAMVQRRRIHALSAVAAPARFAVEVAALRERSGGVLADEVLFRSPSGRCVVVSGETLRPYADDATILSGLDTPEAAAARDDRMLCGHAWFKPSADHPEASVMLMPKDGGDGYEVRVFETTSEPMPRRLKDAIGAAELVEAGQRIAQISRRVDEIKVELAQIKEAEAKVAAGGDGAKATALKANQAAINARVGALLKESVPALRTCFAKYSGSLTDDLILRVDITAKGRVDGVYFPDSMYNDNKPLLSCLGKTIEDWDLSVVAGQVGGRFALDLPFVIKAR